MKFETPVRHLRGTVDRQWVSESGAQGRSGG